MPRVSVVIPAYNCERFIAATLDSVFAQTYTDYELIVVDDGSTDRTAQILDAQAGKLKHVCQANAGVSTARNNGIRCASGEYVALLDHDDLWEREKLERQVALLDSDPSIGLVYSDCYVVDVDNRILHRYFERCSPYRGRILGPLFEGNFIPCLTAVMRRTALDNVGEFSTDLAMAKEYELFLRIAAQFGVEFVDQPLARYRVHEANFSRNTERFLKEALGILREARGKFPELAATLGRRADERLGKLEYHLGVTKFWLGRTGESRSHFLESIRLDGRRPATYAYMAASLLPGRLARAMVSGLKAILGRDQCPIGASEPR